MGIYTNTGTVFTASTVDWARVLASGEKHVDQITRNVIGVLAQLTILISGTVTDSQGDPIPDITVRVEESDPGIVPGIYTTTTDAAGHYSIIVDPPSPYNVVTAAASFEDSDPAAVTIMLDTTTTQDFALVTAMPGSISGMVVDADTQEAIKGATVEAIVYPTSESRSASTDARGNYTLSDVLSGRRQVTASARHYDDSSAQTVRVIAGQTVPGVNFSLTAVPARGSNGRGGSSRF